MPSRHLIPYHPLFLLPPIPPSIRDFSNESALHIRWPKYWSLSFSIIPSKEHPGLISFRKNWLDLLEVQGTLKRLLQHHSLKASILWHSTFFTVQLSHPYMTTDKTIAFLIIANCVILKPSRTLWGSWAWKPFCLPFLVGKTPASMTFPEFQRADSNDY